MNDTQIDTQQARHAAGNMGATVSDAANRFGAQASELGEQAYRHAADAGRYATRQVHEQPIAAMLIAGALGVFLGFLLGRPGAEEPRTLRGYVRDGLR